MALTQRRLPDGSIIIGEGLGIVVPHPVHPDDLNSGKCTGGFRTIDGGMWFIVPQDNEAAAIAAVEASLAKRWTLMQWRADEDAKTPSS